MVRKRRKRKYTWMPTLGGQAAESTRSYDVGHFGATLSVQQTSQGPLNALYVTPIVPDQTFFGLDAQEAEQTLRDLTEGQDWFLKRIVGKLRVAVGQFTEGVGSSTPKVITACGAFFVAKSDDTNPDTPAMLADDYDPLGTRNIRQPWIWRRTWALMNGLAGSPTDGVILEVNNTGAAGAIDGPHIDAKTARRIRREERLWFVFNAYGENRLSGVPSAGPFAESGSIEFQLDYRILGQMRRSSNRSTF